MKTSSTPPQPMTTPAGTLDSPGTSRRARPQRRRRDRGTRAAAQTRVSSPTRSPPRYQPSGVNLAVTTVAAPGGTTQPCFQPSRRIATSRLPAASRATQPSLKFCATVRTDSCDRCPTVSCMVAGSLRISDALTGAVGVATAASGVVKDICRGSNSPVAPAATVLAPAARTTAPAAGPPLVAEPQADHRRGRRCSRSCMVPSTRVRIGLPLTTRVGPNPHGTPVCRAGSTGVLRSSAPRTLTSERPAGSV